MSRPPEEWCVWQRTLSCVVKAAREPLVSGLDKDPDTLSQSSGGTPSHARRSSPAWERSKRPYRPLARSAGKVTPCRTFGRKATAKHGASTRVTPCLCVRPLFRVSLRAAPVCWYVYRHGCTLPLPVESSSQSIPRSEIFELRWLRRRSHSNNLLSMTRRKRGHQRRGTQWPATWLGALNSRIPLRLLLGRLF